MARCQAAGSKKPKAYSLKSWPIAYETAMGTPDFFEPRTPQMATDYLPQ